jgi:hypothetical protein
MSNPDPLDVAFLAIGASYVLGTLSAHEYEHMTDGYGTDGMVSEMLDACSNAVTDAWEATKHEWAHGVWVYDIAEGLGAFWVRESVRLGYHASRDEIEPELARLIKKSIDRYG